MLDQLMITLLMQLQHRIARSRWDRSDDAFYEHFGRQPFTFLCGSALAQLPSWAYPRSGGTRLLPPDAEDCCCSRSDQAAALIRRA